MPEYAAVLLAGGRSSRMGRDKALLPHPASGLPLVAHQLATLHAAGAAPVLLSIRPDQDYATVPAAIPRIHDSGADGPLGALAAAFSALAALPTPTPSHLLMLAVDLPHVSAAFLRALLAAAPTTAVGMVPIHPAASGYFEPLCAIYPIGTPCYHAVTTALTARRLSLQALLATGVAEGWMSPYPIPAKSLPELTNWNHPGDLPSGD